MATVPQPAPIRFQYILSILQELAGIVKGNTL